MAIISWNCRGVGGDNTKRTLLTLFNDHKPDIVFLFETKSCDNVINDLIHASRFENHFSIPSINQSGGLLLLWSNQINLVVSSSNKYIINTKIYYENDKQRIFYLVFLL
ncbi:hypothetical protein FRX31_034799 [Thalictrum thalictroides]|uniref:Uncharacterized protein n=1 Tax=Thalictrum thalictroides TaxID=46969 RepID=A0A7J6USQ5_THATH|nr:hypothetical protein FRX31_034799 [Thalictrum thalictroides]